ncbi:hypothetical protein ACHQM5_023215 [Ranunculus cassubicifolius]
MVSEQNGESTPNSQVSQVDPYFVHHSDNPNTSLVTPQLSGDNYGSWVISISRALRAKNKLGFVDGTIKPPTDLDEKVKWARCDDLVALWLLHSVIPEIRSSLLYAKSALDIWREVFSCATEGLIRSSHVSVY